MHPSEAMRGEKSNILKGKRIALCVTGSIGSVEAVKLSRELIRHGADVYPYLTKTALKFIGEDSLLFATGHQPIVELTGKDEHLYDFDVILVAPATADIISKAACGIADDAVSTLILGNIEKCIFVPTMDMRMYSNPILTENLEKLKKYVKFIEPRMEEGKVKMPDVEGIVANLMNILMDDLKGKRILVIGGAGYERFDNFRIITNLSTGKTAIDIARYSFYYGAEVTLLLGLHTASVPGYIKYERFEGIDDLISRIGEFLSYDGILVPAALPDFKPEKVEGKVKDVGEFNKIEFKENPKFLRELRDRYKGFLVGFKAESNISRDELIRRARERMKEYELDIIVANLIEDVKENDTKAIIIFSDEEIEEFSGRKEDLARRIVEIMVDSL